MSQFTTSLEGIRILGLPLCTSSFTPSFIKNALLENVWHVDLLFKMGDVQVAFGILTHYFMQRPSYLLQCTSPSFTFTFDFSLLQVFGCLLSPRSFDNPKRPLTHKQIFFPMTFGGIKLIPMTTITPTTYLGNWAFITSIIDVRFMVD